ncbi:MAG TPA: 1,4-dihydroxy-6-naphthoate synthase [Chitinophagaceae bacterium]|nr:1,4-dihydroxy-6-naphthoate synthase [Chitinophagaceae bacterium]
MKLSLGFSPCPNDTFIFDALVNKKIDTEGLDFDAVLEDVETLNQWALQGKLDLTKLSFPAFFQSISTYTLLNSGSALGKGVGPLLISKKNIPLPDVESYPTYDIEQATIAIPGENTTANLLLSFAFPNAKKKIPMIFSEIENAVLTNKTDLGVIIHENRFTYQQRGLHKLVDLGEYWEQKIKTPIPLGAIAIKREIKKSISEKIDKLIKQSLEYAYANYPLITEFVKEHSQEMSEDVMRQHIELYVNNYSLDLGDEGKKAIETLYQVFRSQLMVSEQANSGNHLFLS